MPAEKLRLGGLDKVLMFHLARSRLRVMSQFICRLSRKGMVCPIVLFVFLLGIGVREYLVSTVLARAQDWESSIRKFEDADRVNPPKPGGIVFAGASSIRLWGTLLEEMKPLEVTNRGFGGSQYSDLNHYAQRIVMAYHPRAVVVYEGDNDLAAGSPKTPEMVANDAREFVRIVHSELPETWIYIMSIKPSYLRWNEWPKMKAANKLIQDFVKTQDRVQYIDVATPMFYGQDKPPRDLFVEDGLHPTAKCYALWTSIIKPELLHRFGPWNNVSRDAVAPLWFEFGAENAMPSVR
jgi:lysophospholipase L1-like esterase